MKYFTTHTIVIIVAIIIAGTMAVTAQTLSGGYDDSSEYFNSKKHNKWRNSANFKKALAILNNDDEEQIDYDEAIALLENEIKQHPGNGYAVCSAAMARMNEENMELNMFIIELLYGDNGLSNDEAESIYQKRIEEARALTMEYIETIEKGIALIPAADIENICKAYITCGDLQKNNFDDNDKALAAYEQAANILPCYQSYDKLMKLYLEQGDNDKAIYYATKLGNMIDNDDEVLCLLAQAYIDKNDNDKAKTLINKVIANNESNEKAYQLLFNMLTQEGRYQEALDKTIEMSKFVSGNSILQNLVTLFDSNDNNKAMVINKLHQLEAETKNSSEDKEEETIDWEDFEALLHYFDKDYRSALACFDRVLERKPTAHLLLLKADCHYMLGDVPQALKFLNYAIRMPLVEENGIQQQLLNEIFRIEMLCGMTEEQIHDAKIYCMAFSDNAAAGFEALARGYFNKGQYAKALEICEEWAESCQDDIDAKYFHAFVLKLWGKDEIARHEMQDIVNNENCSPEMMIFALFYMGDTEKSRTMLDEMARVSELSATTADDNDMQSETMSFYNLSCAYSLHGDTDRALHFLERHYAEDDGATDFDYAILDDELNNARKDPRFMEIVNRYKQQWLNGGLNLKK